MTQKPMLSVKVRTSLNKTVTFLHKYHLKIDIVKQNHYNNKRDIIKKNNYCFRHLGRHSCN